MAEFLNTEKAYAEIVDIINNAGNTLVLISPYIKIPESLLERLKYIDKKGIKTIVVCRKDDLKDDVRNDIKQLEHLDLRFDENLHAKCFYNEESMVITSLNLHEHSQQHNREMGVLLSLKEDHNIFNEARNEAEFIISGAEKDSFKRSAFRVFREAKSIVETVMQEEPKEYNARKSKHSGFCIRCGQKIPHNLDKPYCADCYSKWKEWENPEYKEPFCHTCGHQAVTTMNKPVCRSCYAHPRR